MAKSLLLDEIHLLFFVPGNVPDSQALPARRTLKSARFQARLQRVLQQFKARHPSLRSLRMSVSR